jgi:hypothetical protein
MSDMGMTASNKLKQLSKERDKLAARLSGYKHTLRGSIIKRGNICGKPVCVCKRKNNPVLHGPYQYLSHRSRKAINMIFLNKKKLSLATKGVREYNELIDLIYRISEINFEILRYHYTGLPDER